MNNLEMRISELEIENERLKEWRFQLERSIEHNNKVMEMLREENEAMSNKLRIYQEHCLNEKKVSSNNALENLHEAITTARAAIKDDILGLC